MEQPGFPLFDAFYGALGDAAGQLDVTPESEPEPLRAAEQILEGLCERGRAGAPEVATDDRAFVRHVAKAVQNRERPLSVVSDLHIEDLFLAFACARGHAEALAAIDARLSIQVASAARSLGESDSFADELGQTMRHRILLAEGDREPRIAGYAGLGPLDGWLRVSCTRAALSARRTGGRELSGSPGVMDHVAASGGAEDDYLIDRYRTDFARAFSDALGRLNDRGRNLIRLHYLDGVGVEKLGVMYKVHASTASRWIKKARDELFDDTRGLLRERLQLSQSEFQDIMAVVRSRLDVSISRYLRDRGD